MFRVLLWFQYSAKRKAVNMILEYDHMLTGLALALLPEKQKNIKRKHSKWVKRWLINRQVYSHMHLINELQLEPDDYRNYLRMEKNSYTELLDFVSPLLQKEDTIMRPAITPHERLSSTLKYLATATVFSNGRFKILNTYICPRFGKNNSRNL